ncbi:hypothetical protein L207DRAFT_538856 [Hyaloscypha variabilis F]|uniref:Uncharacterized protein n=1 Tax=Hyaloscypha variabilis (strain UAMH 11265 / GT02V1 / F) TaxID=1149755 RepID=A0A2J6QT38_HYAVF|nr:hypothetical protein L207DRAFT_538856 [Hyaloscypha variabilis F]
MSGLPYYSHYPVPIVAIPYHHKVPAMPHGPRHSVPMVSRLSHLRTMASLEIPPSHENTIAPTVPHGKGVTQGYTNTITSTPPQVNIPKPMEPPLPHQYTSSPLPPITPNPSPPRSKHQGYGTNPTNQHQPPSYSLTIHPLLSLQHQIHCPSFPTSYPSPPTIHHHRRHLYTQLQTLFSKMKREVLTTFYLRIQCPRCGQLPIIADWEYNGRGLGEMNHCLPREALVLWRTLRREMEVESVDLLRLRQGHLDGVVGGLREVERVFFEGDVGGCGVEAWNGGHGGPPMD